MVAPLLIGGTVVPIMIGNTSVTRRVFAYALATASGQIIVTYSERQFDEGDCARLWHAPLAPFDGKQGYNFVDGTLEPEPSC